MGSLARVCVRCDALCKPAKAGLAPRVNLVLFARGYYFQIDTLEANSCENLASGSKCVRSEAKFLTNLASGSEIDFPEANNLAARG